MPNVLDELRRLEEARARGDIDEKKLSKLRKDILETIEDAEVADEPLYRPPANAALAMARDGALIVVGLTVLAALVAWLTADVMMGITLSVVLLAGVVINAARKLAEEDAAEQTAKPGPALDTHDDKGRSIPAE